MKNCKFKLALVTTILMGAMSCALDESGSRAEPPNFIIIFADDLGYGDLSSYGHPSIKTPFLDQMAREGMRFTQFYVAASICTPSRAGLLTGRLPIRNGMSGNRGVLFPDSGGGLPSEEITIAEALKEKNYQTACIGKWHLGHLPQFLPGQHGFDYYYGIPYSNDMSPDQSNWDYAKSTFPPLPLMENDSLIEVEPDQSLLTLEYTARAISFIRENRSNPFFLYLPHTFPHVPLYIDKKNEGRSLRGLYGDVVEVLDSSVGIILDSIQHFGLSENTFVLFTSDNGPWGWAGINGGSAGLLKGAKGSPWEGGFRVPCIAWMPGTIPAATVSDAIASTMDLLPTILSMAGISYDPANLDGKDISATFIKNEPVQNEVYYYRQSNLVAYRHGPWKLFVQDPNPWNDEFIEEDLPLLYNVEEDPAEKYNVAVEHQDKVQELTQLIQLHQKAVIPVESQLEIIHHDFKDKFDAYHSRTE